MQIKGVDVSKFQGAIDWKKVKEDGIQFALIRAGYGKETSQKDELFEQNYESCAANDIPCGCYWYSYALSPQEAVEEAQACLDVIRGKKFEYPVYLDIESDAQINLGKNIIEQIASSFCSTIENAGYWVGIYSYMSFLEQYLTPDIRNRYSIWVAQIGVNETSYEYQHGVWQYSHTSSVNGINGEVDCNYCYIDYPSAIKEAGLSGYKNLSVSAQILQVYTVIKGDTLWGISERYLGSGDKYPELKKVNFLTSDTIYPGQKIKIPKISEM